MALQCVNTTLTICDSLASYCNSICSSDICYCACVISDYSKQTSQQKCYSYDNQQLALILPLCIGIPCIFILFICIVQRYCYKSKTNTPITTQTSIDWLQPQATSVRPPVYNQIDEKRNKHTENIPINKENPLHKSYLCLPSYKNERIPEEEI